MRNVFAFFYRIRAEILFIALLMLCISGLYKSGPMQRAAIAKRTANVTGSVYAVRNTISSYLHLREENQRLNEALQSLRNKDSEAFTIIPAEQFEYHDKLYRQNYLYRPSEVINSSINKPRNSITINLGDNHGVKIGNGIISVDGMVGVVTKTSANYALVMPIINNQFTASVEIKYKEFFGLLKWDGDSPRFAQIQDMADYANVNIGDTVISRGASAIFPRGIKVGVISEIERQPKLGKLDVTVALSVDFARLRNVAVVDHVYKEELDQLEND